MIKATFRISGERTAWVPATHWQSSNGERMDMCQRAVYSLPQLWVISCPPTFWLPSEETKPLISVSTQKYQSMGWLESDTTERLHFHFSLSCIGEGNGNPLQCSCLETPRDGGAWWAAVYGVAQSRTRLKRLSSSSSSNYK